MVALRPTLDQIGLEIAWVVSRRSTCLRRAVGAVLTDVHGRILATGYNGVSRGLPHCNFEDGMGRKPHACPGAVAASGTRLDDCDAIHAEANALLQCTKIDAIHTCYVTASPCVSCTKLLSQTACQRIIFGESYPAPRAEQLWTKNGYREWLQLK